MNAQYKDRAQLLSGGWHTPFRMIIDLVMPPLCASCRIRVTDAASICPACWSTLSFIERPFCDKTATPFVIDPGPGVLSSEAHHRPPRWNRARAAVLYGGVAARLVHALKYSDRHEVAPLLARLMARAGADILSEADLLVPVPLHRWRLLSRGFNQAALLTERIGRLAGRPWAMDALLRRKDTPQQVGLTREARARNMAGAFAVPAARKSRISNRRIVLIDDVFTSGATLQAATRALKRAGAANVDILVFARVAEVIAAA